MQYVALTRSKDELLFLRHVELDRGIDGRMLGELLARVLFASAAEERAQRSAEERREERRERRRKERAEREREQRRQERQAEEDAWRRYAEQHSRPNEDSGRSGAGGAGMSFEPSESARQQAAALLGVTVDAEKRAVEQAWRKLQRQHHPDKLRAGCDVEERERAKHICQELNEAKAVLLRACGGVGREGDS